MKDRILVVDDMEMNREILKGIFEEDYEVILAENGREAVEYINSNRGKLAARASASGSEELIFCAEDRERVGQAVVEQANALLQKAGKAAKLTLSAETRPMRGGVVLKDGLVETNCSIGTMISGLRPALSGKVAACLFG